LFHLSADTSTSALLPIKALLRVLPSPPIFLEQFSSGIACRRRRQGIKLFQFPPDFCLGFGNTVLGFTFRLLKLLQWRPKFVDRMAQLIALSLGQCMYHIRFTSNVE
tara:strand:- start:26 stop:346 length:321 start_codon:yes stop_codon:yes gene_type:complete